MAADQDVGGEHATFGDIASIADANEKVIRGPYCRMNDAREGVLRKLIDEVFQRAQERLGELRQAPDYKEVVLGLARDGVAKLGEPPEATVRLSASDAGLLSEADLAALAADWRGRVRLSLGPAAEISGGVVIEAADGHKRYDNSFEHRLAELRAALRAEVYQLLQGAA